MFRLGGILGNFHAGRLADQAAFRCQVSTSHVHDYKVWINKFVSVKARLVLLCRDLVQSGTSGDPRPVTQPRISVPLSRVALQSRHVLQVHKGGASCLACFRGVQGAAADKAAFFSTPCHPIAMHAVLPVRIPHDQGVVAGVPIHSSHELWFREALLCVGNVVAMLVLGWLIYVMRVLG